MISQRIEQRGRIKNLSYKNQPKGENIDRSANAVAIHKEVINSLEFQAGLTLALSGNIDVSNKFQTPQKIEFLIGVIKTFLLSVGETELTTLQGTETFQDIVTQKIVTTKLYPLINKLEETNKKTAKMICNELYQNILPAVYVNTVIKLGFARVKKSSAILYGEVVSAACAVDQDSLVYTEFRTLEQKFKHTLEAISTIQFANPDRRQATLCGLKAAELKRYLVSLLKNPNLEATESQNITDLAMIWSQILSSKNMKVYLLNNYQVVSDEILKGLKSGTMNLTITTCPDYSGASNESGVFEYDFETLGSGENSQMEAGVVTEKGFDFALSVRRIMLAKIDTVNLMHLLPTFEFEPEGFKDLSKDQTNDKLSAQAELIRCRYAEVGAVHNLEVGLFKDLIIADEEFWSQRDLLADTISTACADQGEKGKKILSHLKFIYNQRRNLYEKWYPQAANENDEEWKKRLLECVARSVSDYLIVPRLINQGAPQEHGNIVLDCSSAIMIQSHNAGLFSEQGDPVIHGYGAKSGAYAGD